MRTSVAGIGASAGGLEAFKRLLTGLPADTGLAFVFVQHLDPTHPSSLTEILAGASPVPVQQATDGMALVPDHLYVIPPDAELTIADEVLRIRPRPPAASGPHLPIDVFLRSLAQECGSRAIGVILSGAGTDGAAGLEAIKAAGGITFAQDPATAKFDGMPLAAKHNGCVDFVLSPEAIAAALTALAHHPYSAEDEPTESPVPDATLDSQFDSVLSFLRETTGVDFALYRQTTIRRRILRRLPLCNVAGLEEYRKRLETDPGELSALHRDLLISVTCFFRNPDAFASLKMLALPRLIENRPSGAAIRIWIPGCATGEEVYSIAILFKEYFQEAGRHYPLQIFASDISAAAVERARSGKYGETITADVSPERLDRFFTKIEGGYQVNKELRELCVFSRHDLMQDPPFSNLDTISCRNVLIFFGSVRKNAIALLHYALKPGGLLFLGSSETESSNLFSALAGAPGVYTKNETGGRSRSVHAAVAGAPRSFAAHAAAAGIQISSPPAGAALRKDLERALLAKYRGAGVVVDRSLEVLEIIGQTTPYLALPPGKINFNLLSLIPQHRLFLEVESLIREVEKSGVAARRDRILHQSGGKATTVNVEVTPLGAAPARALLVLFESPPDTTGIEPDAGSDPRDDEIKGLKQELEDARQRLLSIMEEHRFSEEDSQNKAYESLSVNEELQSLNEELETAKEELQSTNEELSTVNHELLSNVTALTEARDFARLVVETAEAPLMVLDAQLRIKTANSSFHRSFAVSSHEIDGRPLYGVLHGCFDIWPLRKMLEQVLTEHGAAQRIEVEQDFPGTGRRVLVISARQIGTLHQILVGIEDVTKLKERTDATLHESEDRFRNMADTAPVMIWVSGSDKGCIFFNKRWLDFTGRTLEQELGTGWAENVHPEDLDACLTVYSSAFDARQSFQMEYRLRRADGVYRWLIDTGVPRFDSEGVLAGFIGSCTDITELRRAHEENLAKARLESIGALAGGIAHDFNNLLGGVLAHSELALAELANGSSPVEELQRIRGAAIRGAEIVRQLMVYTGQESGTSEWVDVSAIVADMVELLRVSVSKHVHVETDLRKNLPAVRANPGQIRQVVMNLITNASEAIGERDGVIRLTTGRVSIGRNSPLVTAERLTRGEYVQLEVSDSGRGMTPELQLRVFDPFFTTKVEGSHGLGLVVVQRVIRDLHGAILLSSVPDAGTTFQILLPCQQQAIAPAEPVIPREEERLPRSREATILVVEDEDVLRQAISKMLRKNGLSVLEAIDGSAALDVIRAPANQIDVVLLDVTLPGASSREVYEETRRLRPDLPVIVTSANSREIAVARLATRIERFLRKPFRLAELVSMIGAILSA